MREEARPPGVGTSLPDIALNIAKEIALEAAELLRQGQLKGFSLDTKSTSIDLVTEYDELAEKLIVERLRQSFPEHGIVAEEGSSAAGSGEEDYRWYVDPLDGTNNFAHRIPQFAVSMGLFKGDRPELAVVADPMRGELFWAQRGKGAFLNGERLKVSEAATVDRAVLATGFPYDRHHDSVDNFAQLQAFLKRCQGLRRFGACSLDLSWVAAGRLDGFWEFKLAAWDIAAGLLLVEEAGGRVSRIDGSPIGFPTKKNHVVLSNGQIHQEMLEILKPTLTEKHLWTGPSVL